MRSGDNRAPSAVEEDTIGARFKSGVIETVLSKAKMAEPKRIEVETQ